MNTNSHEEIARMLMRLDRKMKISFPEQIRTGKIIDYSPDSYIILTAK